MLVLSRKRDERVVIEAGGEIILQCVVVEVRGDKVRLGFEADPTVKIHRQEVWDEIKERGAKDARRAS
jgi:carbon storage regulator